ALRSQRVPALSGLDALSPGRARARPEAARVKVLVVTNMWPSAERPHWAAFVKSQTDSLEAAGCATSIYEIQRYRPLGAYLRGLGEIPRGARERGSELVHAHSGLSGAAAERVKLPLVVSFCGDDLLGRPAADGRLSLMSRALIPLSRHAARRANAVI